MRIKNWNLDNNIWVNRVTKEEIFIDTGTDRGRQLFFVVSKKLGEKYGGTFDNALVSLKEAKEVAYNYMRRNIVEEKNGN